MVDYENVFHNFVYSGKIFLVIALLVLSIVNGHKEYVEKEPRKFFSGALIFSLAMAMGSAFIAANRGGEWTGPAFITFLFFFFFAVCREFSGFYALMSGHKTTQNEDKERKILIPLSITVGILGFIMATYLVTKTQVFPPPPEEMKFMRFPLELLVFVILGSLGEIGVSLQHGDNSPGSIVSSILIYVAAHMYLQFGGFYDHVFAPVNWGNLKVA